MNVVVVVQSIFNFSQSFYASLHVEKGDSGLVLLDDFILNSKVLYFK